MAAIVTKIGATGFGRPTVRGDRRSGRVARVTAKRPKDDEPELDPEALASEDVEVVAKKQARPDSGTYLSMYFRDMAALDVLRPEEEFTSAREIESLEIMLWEAVLSHAPAVEPILDAVEEPILALPIEVKNLRRAAAHPDPKAYREARRARRAQAARRGHRSPVHRRRARARSIASRSASACAARSVGSLGRDRARHRVAAPRRQCEPRRGRRAQRLREGEPAPGRHHRAPVQPRPDGARRPDPGGQPRPDQGGRALRLPLAASGSRPTRAGGSATRSAARSPTRAARSGCRCT